MRNFGGTLIKARGGRTEASACKFLAILNEYVDLAYAAAHNCIPSDLVVGNLMDPKARHLMLISRGDAAICLLKLPTIKKALDNPVVMLASPFEDDLGDEHAYLQLSRIILYMESGRQLIIKGHDNIYGALYDMLNQNYTEVRLGPRVTRNCRIALGGLHNEHCPVHPNFRCIMLEEERDIATSDPPRLNRCEKQRLEYIDVLDDRGRSLLVPLETFCREMSTFPHHGGELGLLWEDVGTSRPMTGDEFFNADLGNALQRKQEFTHNELKHFGVDGLHHDSFIRCDGNNETRYFKPMDGFTTRDTFCGFNEDTLPSLLVREIYFNDGNNSSEQDLLTTCKEALLDMMPSDAVARAGASLFGRNPDNEAELAMLTARYHTQFYHAGLKDCLTHFWPNINMLDDSSPQTGLASAGTERSRTTPSMATEVQSSADCQERHRHHHDLLILTFTAYTCSIAQLMQEHGFSTDMVRVEQIGQFTSERRLRKEVIEAFWSPKDPRQMLIIQCDSIMHSKHVLLLREIMMECEQAYRNAAAADTCVASIQKEQAIVLHLQRFHAATDGLGEGSVPWQFSCLSEWKQVVVDQLEGTAETFKLLLEARNVASAAALVLTGDAATETSALPTLQQLIGSQIAWCLHRIRYPHRSPSKTWAYMQRLVDTIVPMAGERPNSRVGMHRVMAEIQRRVQHALHYLSPTGHESRHWLEELACNQGALLNSSNLTSAILEQINKVVRVPLTHLLWDLEKNSALALLLSDEVRTNALDIWLQLFLPPDEVLGDAAAEVLNAHRVQLGLESCMLEFHYTNLQWVMSLEITRQLNLRRLELEDECKEPINAEGRRKWSIGKLDAVKRSVYSGLVKDDGLLRHFASHLAARASQTGNACTNEMASSSASGAVCAEAITMSDGKSFADDNKKCCEAEAAELEAQLISVAEVSTSPSALAPVAEAPSFQHPPTSPQLPHPPTVQTMLFSAQDLGAAVRAIGDAYATYAIYLETNGIDIETIVESFVGDDREVDLDALFKEGPKINQVHRSRLRRSLNGLLQLAATPSPPPYPPLSPSSLPLPSRLLSVLPQLSPSAPTNSELPVSHAEAAPESGIVKSDGIALNDAQLASLLEASFLHHRNAFFSDFVKILTEKVAQYTTSTRATEVISQVVQLALQFSTPDWHSFDLIVKSWKVEALLRHAVDLYLLVDFQEAPKIESPSNCEFALRLIEMAARTCLQSLGTSPSAAGLGAWLARTSRCINFALAMQAACDELSEDGDAATGKCPHLEKLKICRDLGANVVEPHEVGHKLLIDLCSSAVTVDKLADRLHELQLSNLKESQATAVEGFKYMLISRLLHDKESKQSGLESLCHCLQHSDVRQRGQVPAAVAIALTEALSCLGIMDFDPAAEEDGAKAPIFGEQLDRVLSESIRNATWQSSLVCSILQAEFFCRIDCCISDTKQFNTCCKSFEQAVRKLSSEIGKGLPAAICHAAYAKAFLQVVSNRMEIMKRKPTSSFENSAMCVLRDELGDAMTKGPCATTPEIAHNLRVYLLKELRKSYGLPQIMHLCMEEYLGKQLPALKNMVCEAEDSIWASKLNFDPFAKLYVHREMRDQIQLAWDRTRRGELVDKMVLTTQVSLFGIASAIYIPRSLRHRESDLALRTLACLVDEDPSNLANQSTHNAGLVNLTRALASNNFSKLVPPEVATLLSLEQSSADTTVFAASLAIHVAGVFSPEAMETNPLACYACNPVACQDKFMLAAQGNIVGSVLAALGTPMYRYRCKCGYVYLVGECGNTVEGQDGTGTCPSCHVSIGNRGGGGYNQLAEGQTRIDVGNPAANLAEEPGYIRHDRIDLSRLEHTLQRSNNAPMSRVSFRVLHLLVHLSLFAYPLVHEGADGLHILMPNEASPVNCVWEQVIQDLEVLRRLLDAHAFDEVVALLHTIIERLPRWCHGRSGELRTAAERNAWEHAFAEHFIEPATLTLQQTLRRCVDEYQHAVGNVPRLHREIDEDKTLDSTTLFHPSLFAVTLHPSFKIVCATFDSAPRYRQEHPFLALYLEWQPILVLVQQLWPLTRWYRMLREHWGNLLSREDAQKTTVGQLLEHANSRLGAEEIFDDFSDAWNAIVVALKHGEPLSEGERARDDRVEGRSFYDRYRETECHPLAPSKISMMSRERVVGLCCLEEGQVLDKFLQLLARAHNDFLHRAANLVGRTPALRFKARDGNVIDFGQEMMLNDMQHSHMLLTKQTHTLQELNSTMASKYRICQPGYGRGKHVSFDFAAIEYQLALTLLTSVSHIATNQRGEVVVEPFEFAGEVLNRSLNLMSLIDTFVPQEQLDNMSTLRQLSANFLAEIKNGRALLSLLETVMFKCTKTRPFKDQLISEFCQEFDIMGFEIGVNTMFHLRHFVLKVLNDPPRVQVRLKHLRALHEEVEIKIATKLIESSRPHERFQAELDHEWRSTDPGLEGYTLVDHICAKFGSHIAEQTATSAVSAGRQRLQGPLKLFIVRNLMLSSDEAGTAADRRANYPLSYEMCDPVTFEVNEAFPWAKDTELSAAEAEVIDKMLPSIVQVKHAYRLLLHMQELDKNTQLLAAHGTVQGTAISRPHSSGPRRMKLFGRG